jgi:hypothetical protein
MPVSSRPSDKFAFLFTGLTTARYIADLKSVYDTLVDYYNYPAANIWVVQGANAFVNPSSFSTINQFAIGTGDPLQNLKDLFHNNATSFAKTVNNHFTADPPPSGEYCTALVYFTGAQDPGNLTLNTNLILRPDAGVSEVGIAPSDFTLLLQYPNNQPTPANPLLRFCHLNVIMQQDYSGLYYNSVITDATRIINRSFTNSCGSAETALAGSTCSRFTEVWTEALKFGKLDNLDPLDVDYSKYADLLAPVTDQYLISLQQAEIFASKRAPAANYGFDQRLTGESALYLGKPVLLIQDGDNSTVGWWESPDIYLTHLGFPGKKDDLYIPDPLSDVTSPWNNTVNVAFRNTGTHPVRAYSIGIQIYRTPLGTADNTLTVSNMDTGSPLKPTILTGYNTFSNSNMLVYQWENPFYTGITHECIRAKVQLPITPISLVWDVLAGEAEAQRNTDVSYDPPKKGHRVRPGDEFRGNKKHLYSVHNPFKETHKFVITTTPEFQSSLNSVSMNWYVSGKNNKWEKLVFEKIDKGFYGATFMLQGGEVKSILGEFGFKTDPKDRKARLPVEILIDRINGDKTRKPQAPSLAGTLSAIAGFTIILTYAPASIQIKVVDEKNRPVPDAAIHIQTVNGLNKEKLTADKNGELTLKSINPDVFTLKATSDSGESEGQILQLSGGESAKVKLEIIRTKHRTAKKRK